MARYVIEIEPEVEEWLAGLSDRAYGQAEFYADLLADRGDRLGMPYARHLDGKVWELRPAILGSATRITYWFAPGRRAVLLTIFPKTRPREEREIQRAVTAQKECEANHSHAAKIYER
jgi:hypothetical protein